uniref:Putative secreted protein n=1 Tax=Anopheles darlingi TaxID=43151 RepID=A0A2M4DJX2_ANODA
MLIVCHLRSLAGWLLAAPNAILVSLPFSYANLLPLFLGSAPRGTHSSIGGSSSSRSKVICYSRTQTMAMFVHFPGNKSITLSRRPFWFCCGARY